MPRIKLTKDEEPLEIIPTLDESFTDEYAERLDELLTLYCHYKVTIAQAQEMIDGDEKTKPPVIGLKAQILGMLEEAEMDTPFQHFNLKWKRRLGSRSTISREALIIAGVPVAKVDAATKTSKFWVLEMDGLDERQLR